MSLRGCDNVTTGNVTYVSNDQTSSSFKGQPTAVVDVHPTGPAQPISLSPLTHVSSYAYLTAASTHLGLPGPKDVDTTILRDIQQRHVMEDPNLHIHCSFGTRTYILYCSLSLIVPLNGTSLNNELGVVLAYCKVRHSVLLGGIFGHNIGPVFELGTSH